MPTSKQTRSIRLWIIASFATIAAVVGAVLVPMAANASTVELSGTVTGSTGKALAGVSVSAVEITLGVPSILATTTTSSTGAYTFASLAEGSDYSLQFGVTSTTYPQYLGDTSDVSSAEIFALMAGAGAAHTTINASLAASGNIAGTVKSITHAALNGYTVRAFADGSDVTPVRSAVSGSTGTYTITGLEPGLYQLEAIDTAANPPYGPVYSGGSTSLDNASTVQVVGAKTVTSSFTLGKPGSVSGVVTGDITSGTQPLGDVRVTPYLLSGTPSSFTHETTTGMPSVLTSSSGAYSLHGLIPGYYALDFTPGPSTPLTSASDHYGQSFLGNGDDYVLGPSAWVHVVSGGTVTGANEDLEEEANATVNVTDSSTTDPIANIQVTIDYLGSAADQPGDNASQTALTDASGNVTFHGLAAGFYQVTVGSNSDAGGSITTYQREIVPFGSQLIAGTTPIEFIEATLKDPDGLHATVTPTLSSGSGPYSVGEYVAVDPQSITWNVPDVDPDADTVQWYRDGVAIPGATNTNYLLQADDSGRSVSVVVTGHDLTYGSGTAATTPFSVGGGSFSANGGGGGVYGTEEVGQTLHYISSGWSIEGVTETDVWQVSTDGGSTWNPMNPQPSGTSYVVQPGDIGHEIRMDVTGYLPGYFPAHYDTPGAPVYEGEFTITTPPKLTTTSTSWTVSSGTWFPDAGTTQYNWYVSGVQEGTGATFSRAGTAGEWVYVEAYRDPPGYVEDFADTIRVQTGSAPTPNSTATIGGTPEWDTTLTANVPSFTPNVNNPTCEWQYKSGSTWKAIPFAVHCTFTPGLTDIGHFVRVVITAAQEGYATTTLIVAEPTAVVPQPLTNSSLPGVSGSALTNEQVTAGAGTWSTSPDSYAYHWKYSANGLGPYKTAPGVSTDQSYTIPQSLLNQVLLVDVTATVAGHVKATATSSAGTVEKGELTELTAPKTKLTGTLLTGETLTFSGATFSPTPTKVSYYVYVYAQNSSLPISNGPISASNSYSIPTAYEHDYIDVQGGGTLAGYNSGSPSYGSLALAKKGDEEPSGTLTIAGNTVGTAVTSSGLSWSVTGSTIGYQWQYKLGTAWKSIAGATSSSFTPTSAHAGKVVRLVETASAANFNSMSVDSSNTETVTAGPAPTAGTGGAEPLISGGIQVGDTLSIDPGTWSMTGLTFTYQWQTSPNGTTWTNITGAKSSHQVIPLSAYLNSDYLGVVITASKPGYTPGTTLVSSPGQALEGNVPLIKTPTVKLSGHTLILSNGTWGVASTYNYGWVAVTPAGSLLSVGTDSPSYTPDGSVVGDAIYGEVVASAPNYLGSAAQFLVRSGGPITPTTPITVTGTAATGSTLTDSWTGFSVTGAAETYQWYRSGKAIPGATSQDYNPVTADIGKLLSAVLMVTRAGWTTEKYSAAASTVTQNGDSIGYSAPPFITGTPTVDSVLTAHNATWAESGVAVTYQWLRGNLPIPGATGPTYVVTATDLGNDIYLGVTGTKVYQQSAYAQGGPFTILEGDAPTTTTTLKITGTPAIGDTLGTNSVAWTYPSTLTYEWQYKASGSFVWVDITGANASTYTLSAADGIAAPGQIQLIVHATRLGHFSGTVTTAAVTIT